MKKKRIGIFGGTFNPPHNGHVSAAKCFKGQMQLDILMIVPSFIPPHKEYSSTVTCSERLEMCKIAFSEIDSVIISDMEILRGGTSYTYLTLEELYDDSVELFFLCGTDMILSMDHWRCPEKIFKLANICYIRREKDANNDVVIGHKVEEYRLKYGAVIYSISCDVLEISSTEIRKSRDTTEGFLPDGVVEYISKRGLYRDV